RLGSSKEPPGGFPSRTPSSSWGRSQRGERAQALPPLGVPGAAFCRGQTSVRSGPLLRPAAGLVRPLPEHLAARGDAAERPAHVPVPSGNTHHAGSSDDAPALKEQEAAAAEPPTPRASAASDVFAIATGARPVLLPRFLEISLAPCLGAILKVKLRLLQA